MKNITKYVYDCFTELVKNFGLTKSNEVDENDNWLIEYKATSFYIKLEKYRREIYTTLFRHDDPEGEINLFNLLQFLNQNEAKKIESNFFEDETDLEECFKKQLSHISTTISTHFHSIETFFNSEDFTTKKIELNNFMKQQYPELFG